MPSCSAECCKMYIEFITMDTFGWSGGKKRKWKKINAKKEEGIMLLIFIETTWAVKSHIAT